MVIVVILIKEADGDDRPTWGVVIVVLLERVMVIGLRGGGNGCGVKEDDGDGNRL